MKRIVLAAILLLLSAVPAFPQGQSATALNPLNGSITATSAACLTASSCVWMRVPQNLGNLSAATLAVTLSGTFSATVVIEESSDGVNFSTLATYTTVQSNVVFNISGMTDVRARASAYTSGSALVNLQASSGPGPAAAGTAAVGTVGITNTVGTSDPCQNPSLTKSSVAINIATATTTSLVAVSGTTVVYVCSLSLTISQVVTTANTFQLEYGTGASCTSPTVLTGTFGAGGVTAGAPIYIWAGYGGTLAKSAAAAGVCALTAIGASGTFQGVLTFVQQ